MVNFIISWTSYVDLDEYLYSLMKHESEIIWYDQMGFQTGIKINKKDKSLRFNQSDRCFWVSLGHKDLCESCSTNCNVLRHFNMVDVPEHCNHILSNSVWSKLSLTKLRYYCLELLIWYANTHFSIGNHLSSWKPTLYMSWCVVVSRKLDLCKINYLCSISLDNYGCIFHN